MRPFLRALILSYAAIPFTGSGAIAGFLRYETEFAIGSAGTPTPDGYIPLFDPGAIGPNATLLSVRIEYVMNTVTPTGAFRVANRTGAPVDVRATFGDATHLETFGLAPSDLSFFTAGYGAGTYEVTLGALGTGAFAPSSSIKGAVDISNPVFLPSFTGTGGFQFLTNHTFFVVATNPSDPATIDATLSPDWSSTGHVVVTYSYVTPAPPGLALVASALPFGAFFLRRRLTARSA